jgi:hypothetical protein
MGLTWDQSSVSALQYDYTVSYRCFWKPYKTASTVDFLFGGLNSCTFGTPNPP